MTANPIRHIEHLTLAVQASRRAKGVPSAVRRLETIVTDAVRSVLADEKLSAEDGVWLIERLDVDLTIDPMLPAAVIKRGIEQAAARSVVAKLRPGAAGVLHLRRRADHLGRFLIRLAAGDPWGHWSSAPFAGLRYLSTSDAIRTALTADVPVGMEALAGLAPTDAERVIAALSPIGARRVLAALTASGAAGAQQVVEAAIAMRVAVAPILPVDHMAATALSIAVAAVRAGVVPQSAAAWLLAGLVHAGVGSEHPQGAQSSSIHEVRRRIAEASGGDPAILAPLARLDRETILEVMASTEAVRLPEGGETRAAGFAMLLPIIHAAAEAVFAADMTAMAYARLVLLLKCAGPRLAPSIARDPLIRDLYGLHPTVRPASAAAWLAELDGDTVAHIAATAISRTRRGGPSAILRPGDRDELAGLPSNATGIPGDRAFTLLAGAVMRALARRLPGFGASSARYLVMNFLSAGGRVEEREDAVVVTLKRPPLGVILSMTGVARGRHVFPWLSERPLFLELAA